LKNLTDANNPYIVVIFFTLLLIVGAFLLINLVLAVLSNALGKSDSIEARLNTRKKLETAISVSRM